MSEFDMMQLVVAVGELCGTNFKPDWNHLSQMGHFWARHNSNLSSQQSDNIK